MRRRLAILLSVFTLSGVLRADDDDEPTTVQAQVDGYLFFATNENVSSASDEAVAAEKSISAPVLASLRAKLARAFPQKNYQLLGLHTQNLLKDYESWVVPSKELCLKIDSRGATENQGIKVHLQLWQEKKVLVKSDIVLKPGQPIFMGGPDWRKGRLIFVVVLK